MRRHVSSGTEWEDRVGYSRAVRVGREIRVSGTTATDENGDVVGPGEPYEQTKQAIRNVESALEELGGGLEDVVRTRMYVTDIDDWEAVGRAHGEAFGEGRGRGETVDIRTGRSRPASGVRPAATMVEVSGLIDDDLVVELEVDAVVEGDEERNDAAITGGE